MVFIGNHRIIFCSKDDYLLRGAELLGLDTNNDLPDLIKELREGQFDYTVCTASNPHFSMGAGWDAAIKRLHPELCQKKFDKLHPYNERMGNLLFLITV